MSEEFSAAFYQDYSRAELLAEAERLEVSIDGKFDDDAINIVYNAELRRRSKESAEVATPPQQQQETIQRVSDDTPNPDLAPDEDEDEADADADADDGLEDMTIAELRQYAVESDIVLGDATRKADIIAAIRAAEADSDDGDDGDDGDAEADSEQSEDSL